MDYFEDASSFPRPAPSAGGSSGPKTPPNWMAGFVTVLVFFVIALTLAILFGISYGQKGSCDASGHGLFPRIPVAPSGLNPRKDKEQ
jgi:hypothetical protein